MKKLLVSLLFLPSVVFADEDIGALMAKVKELADKKNYAAAMKELSWVQTELNKQHLKMIASFFPDAVGEFKAAGDVESNAAFGMSSTERTYKRGDGAELKVQLAGAGGGAGDKGLGALFGGLAQMGGMMQQPGQDTMRIGSRTGIFEKQPSGAKLSVVLKEGGMFTFEVDKPIEADALKKVAEGFKLDDLEKYMQG